MMVLGKPKYRKLTVVPRIYRSKIGAPRGMTFSQHEDLQADWIRYGDGEPLGAGLSRVWWMPIWNEQTGSDEFAVPVMAHEMELFPTREEDDVYYAQQTLALAQFHQILWLFTKRRTQLFLIKLRRILSHT